MRLRVRDEAPERQRIDVAVRDELRPERMNVTCVLSGRSVSSFVTIVAVM